jgi:hypothetical protein
MASNSSRPDLHPEVVCPRSCRELVRAARTAGSLLAFDASMPDRFAHVA